MGEFKNVNEYFKFSDLEDFFKKCNFGKENSKHWYLDSRKHNIYAYIHAFRYEKLNNVDILPEYIKIHDYINRYISIKDSYDWIEDNHFETLDDVVKYLLEYEGSWNVDNILNAYGLSKERIQEGKGEIKEDRINLKTKEKEKRSAENEEYFERYSKKRETTDAEINKYLSDYNLIDKDYIDVSKVKYPCVLFLHKADKVTSIHKVISGLDGALARYRKNKDFDKYSYIHVNELHVEDVLAEAMIKANPIDMHSNAINLNNTIYRSLNHIKIAHRYNQKVDLRVIKKVINIYEIPLYNLNNSTQVVNRDRFETALSKYLNGK